MALANDEVPAPRRPTLTLPVRKATPAFEKPVDSVDGQMVSIPARHHSQVPHDQNIHATPTS